MRNKYIIRKDTGFYTNRDELEHFDLPKINLPKIELPNIDIPFLNNKKSLVDKYKSKDKNPKKVKKSSSGLTKSKLNQDGTKKETQRYGVKGREWKKHKWASRERNKEGKFIYDYGDNTIAGGVKKEKKPEFKMNKKGFEYDPKFKKDKNIKLNAPSFLEKILNPVFGLGELLLGPDLETKAAGGEKFVGGLIEGVENLQAQFRKFGEEKDEKTGLALKDKQGTKEEDLALTNPGYENPDGASRNNCPGCSMAYELRQRGYDVTARDTNDPLTNENVVSFFDNADVHEIVPYTNNVQVDYKNGTVINQGLTDAVYEQINTEPDGSRGVMWVQWYPEGNGGHIFNYEIENGEPYVYDAQPGIKVALSDYTNLAATCDYYRTDNLEPNWEQVKKVVE